jgi:hypothetical protein
MEFAFSRLLEEPLRANDSYQSMDMEWYSMKPSLLSLWIALPVVAFRSRIPFIRMRVACKNRVVAWTADLAFIYRVKESTVENIDRENLFPQAYRVDFFN